MSLNKKHFIVFLFTPNIFSQIYGESLQINKKSEIKTKKDNLLQSFIITVSEVGKPHFLTKFPPNLSVHEGENVRLFAKASDDVTKLVWSRDGTQISDGGPYK